MSIRRQLADALDNDDVKAFAKLMQDYPEDVWENPVTKDRTIFLFLATSSGQLPIVKLLIEAGANINAPKSDDSRQSPEGVIDTACSEGHLELAQWLLDHGAKINHEVSGKTRCFALVGAAGSGHLDVIKLLVERGAAFNSEWSGMTALDHAYTYRQKAVVEYLLSIGAKQAKEL